MRSHFKKRQSIFIKLIHDQAAFTLEGMEALKAYMAEDTSAAERLDYKLKRKPMKPGVS